MYASYRWNEGDWLDLLEYVHAKALAERDHVALDSLLIAHVLSRTP